MIIYNKTWLKNLDIQRQLQKSLDHGDISNVEYDAIKAKYPQEFYTPNLFIRAGVFILTIIIISFSLLLLFSLLQAPFNTLVLFFISAVCYFTLEFMIKHLYHFNSGVDDALLWVSAGFLTTAFILLLDLVTLSNYASYQLITAAFLFLLGTYFSLRFADLLMTAATFSCLIAFIFLGWLRIGFYSLATMPFLIMLVSGVIYYASVSARAKKAAVWYHNCLSVLQFTSLLTLYAAGNYFVVRELGSELSTGNPVINKGVPLGWFFWGWTFIVPFIYIWFGVKKKSVILLRTGLVLIAAAAFTFRNYHHVLPVESALCLAGILLLIVAYSVTKYLKTPKYGFTHEDKEDGTLLDKIQVESLVVSETFSTQTPQTERMGGGSFGGGGASGNF